MLSTVIPPDICVVVPVSAPASASVPAPAPAPVADPAIISARFSSWSLVLP